MMKKWIKKWGKEITTPIPSKDKVEELRSDLDFKNDKIQARLEELLLDIEKLEILNQELANIIANIQEYPEYSYALLKSKYDELVVMNENLIKINNKLLDEHDERNQCKIFTLKDYQEKEEEVNHLKHVIKVNQDSYLEKERIQVYEILRTLHSFNKLDHNVTKMIGEVMGVDAFKICREQGITYKIS